MMQQSNVFHEFFYIFVWNSKDTLGKHKLEWRNFKVISLVTDQVVYTYLSLKIKN